MKLDTKLIVGAAIAGATFLGAAAGSVLSTQIAGAAQTATTTAPASAPTNPQFDPTKGGHVGANGVKEELLNGDTAAKVKAAALAAVPGGTIERVENDAEGAAYEAHMTKSDGSHVTVKLDSSFKVTSTEAGPGPHN